MSAKKPIRIRKAVKRRKVRVAIIGVGNCAQSLVECVYRYRAASEKSTVPGLMHVNLGGYHIRDIEFSAAIDINRTKVGKDLAYAIHAAPNNAVRIGKVPKTGVIVQRGMTHDGIGKYLKDVIKPAKGESVDVVKLLRETKTDVVVNYLPVGSEEATKWYVEQILQAGCALVNCIPVFIAREPYWQRRFKKARLPVLGDDIKSQLGATILHRMLTNLFISRGMKILRTYQLNTGGNTDFLNMLEHERLVSKKISKTNAVVSQIKNAGLTIDPENVHIGPSDYVPWQKDNKLCFLRIEGLHIGDVPMDIECRLSVQDSPNSAGIVIDAVRFAKLALDRHLSGAIAEPSAYFFKSPPIQPTDDDAHRMSEAFIKKYGHR
ncbi:MAG: inositol-3-phosphate synthase [Patescibacteria group bacterium]|jgi:myo-inositol-1-phosphate synthase